ncbi:hypothetical protein BT96DRAFT_992380 [Gymnopus androsaceus JB14]|uniref:Uncharacterized protein n=1 Tax=Gymnopus androsaceus JB14 TaxID=1447944 RepID=A0A6A4HSR1_9AGAR|nr:hypothetical protein BT96DRAFT_992380 [Gymnopus androsaceus JB14]
MVSVTKPIIALTRKIHSYFNTSDLPPVKPPDSTGNDFRISRSTRTSKFIRPAASNSEPLNPPERIPYGYPPVPMPYTYPPQFPYNLPYQTPYPYQYPLQPQPTIPSQILVAAPNKTQTRTSSPKKGVRFSSPALSSASSHEQSESELESESPNNVQPQLLTSAYQRHTSDAYNHLPALR